MNFFDYTEERFADTQSILCIGLDPVIEKLPLRKSSVEETLVAFFSEIIEHFGKYAAALKPNIAFFEQYGNEGLTALKKIIRKGKENRIPVILDAKRGDIGNTSRAYAKAAFEELEADAITLAPYMGTDSLSPFFQWKEKGFFILARTSNPGSCDFQMMKLENGKLLYEAVMEKIVQWNQEFQTAVGAVAGATQIKELEQIADHFVKNNCPPLLIPGVGKQGGSFEEVLQILRKCHYDLSRVFINSSSKILYAYQDHPDLHYLEASELEIRKMLLK